MDSLDRAVKDAVRIARKQHDDQDISVMALYSFSKPGTAFVVWMDRAPDGTWDLRDRRNRREPMGDS